jgi:serine/threonine protein kinase
LADHGPTLGEPKLRSIAAQLCDAVAAAHAIGVLHRDLKPENVFLRNDHTAVLGDFGIARLGDGNNTAAPQLTATLAFAPPEILNGHPPSIQADVYGIGVTIAAAAIGRSPRSWLGSWMGRYRTSSNTASRQSLRNFFNWL